MHEIYGNHSLARVIPMLAVFLGGFSSSAMEFPDAVKSSIHNRVDSGNAVGIVVGYTDEQGVAYYGYGATQRRDGDVPDENTVFEIGAVTNLFTGLLLADAVARQEIGYDDPLSKHLPAEVRIPKRVDDVVKVEQLSTHYSGLPRLPNNFRPTNRNNPYAGYTVSNMYEALKSLQLDSAPGTEFQYSNFGVGLLGHLLELASGESYEALLKSRIAKPLGLPDTTVSLSEDQKTRLAEGHYRGMPVSNWDMPTLAGAGAVRSTAKDLVRFLEVQLGMQDILFMDSILETHRSRGEAHTDSQEIGLGWFIMWRMNKPEVFWHNGVTGGYQCFVAFTKDPLRGVVVLTNSSMADIDDIALHMLDDEIPLREQDRPGR